ncbi:unnamed protein product [Schistosoma mattheei]|uniref:Uncharacterized protein n=1 Tax=Schistosoma mattheei TaxID=31246 RepID=A0A183PE35_9TREM|nr:unnamed protein product [Schistosoma mattheei]
MKFPEDIKLSLGDNFNDFLSILFQLLTSLIVQ